MRRVIEPMKSDISTKSELTQIVNNFYDKAINDEVIGHFFTDVMQLDLETHLPKIVNFWASILLGETGYRENVMLKHLQLHEISPLEKKHFDQWLLLWSQTINDNYRGEKAELAVQRANDIALLMQHKISAAQK